MKLLVIVLALTMTAACASKNKATTAPTAQTETPATMKASQPEKVEAKKEVKQSGKKAAKKETSASDAPAASVAGEVNCKSGTDERKLAIQPKDQGCELMYTKAGETKSIASQVVGNEKCETVMASIKEKLTTAGFTCQ